MVSLRNSFRMSTMFYRILLFNIVLASAFISGCSIDTKFNTYESTEGFTLEVPSYMSETEDLNPNAIIGFENQREETYLVIFEHSKAEFEDFWKKKDAWDASADLLTNYSNSNVTDLEEFTKDGQTKSMEPLQINGLNATICKYEATVEDDRALYYTASIESDSTFYTLMAWTMANQEEDVDQDFQKMLKSFKKNN